MKLNKNKKYESNKPTTKAFEAYVTASKNADMSRCHDASNPAPQCPSDRITSMCEKPCRSLFCDRRGEAVSGGLSTLSV